MAKLKVTKTTPIIEVLKASMEGKGFVSIEEISVFIKGSVQRSYPQTPYNEVALIYKLGTNVLNCEVDTSALGDTRPVIKNENGITLDFLSPDTDPVPLNMFAESLAKVKLSLPND